MMRAAGMIFVATMMCAIAAHAQPQARVTIVALGASNTEGWGVSTSEAYPAKLEALLNARGINARVINAGIAGDTTGGMLARLEHAIPAGTHLVILQPGTNDERMGLGAVRAGNIEKIRSWLSARNAKPDRHRQHNAGCAAAGELREDGLHFTPAGYAILAERILPQVLAVLGR